MKQVIALAAMALTALCANAQSPKAADAKAGCVPPPKELEKKDLEVGTGRVIVARSAIVVNYTGWLYDGCAKDRKGAQFDTSIGRATPFGFMLGVGKVIKGWDEGLAGMGEKGAKRLLVIPPDKGYGEKGTPDGKIPPNATLVFEVEVLQLLYDPSGAPPPAGAPAPATPVPAAPKK